MIGNVPHDRDELLVTGIQPVTGPHTLPFGTVPAADSEADTRTDTRTDAVFVDATGWRARFGRRLGLAAGAVLLVFLGALGLGMATGPNVPLTPWSEPSGGPRVHVSTPEAPAGKPGDQRTGTRPGTPTGGERPAAPLPAPSGAGTSAVRTPAPTATHPGRSQATPPAWGRKKKNR